MTNKKEQARKLREVADVIREIRYVDVTLLRFPDALDRLADELDPPKEDKGRISEAKLREWVEAKAWAPDREYGGVVSSRQLLAAIDSGELRGE